MRRRSNDERIIAILHKLLERSEMELAGALRLLPDQPIPAPRLPWAPLAARCADDDSVIGEQLGVTRRTVVRMRARGDVSIEDAEKYAHRLHLHPCEIWQHDYTAAVAAAHEGDDE